jgi:intein/homing endonuclease/glycosyltransferase involved in cell wall biosynthesis
MGRKRVLAVGDGAAPTGFSTVMTNILKRLPQDEFEIHHLAINYKGDPHNNSWKMYPAGLGNDPQGYGRLPSLLNNQFDCIFMLNDIWVINKYLAIVGEKSAKVPPIIVYFPVDASKLSERYFNNFELVTKCCTYTEFAKKEVLATRPDLDVKIISHGLDTTVFHKLDINKRELKRQVLGNIDDVEDSFIVLFAQRNQPRKRLDISIKAFSMFAENKPKNVQLWTHCGIKDMGIDLLSFSHRYGVDHRLITSDHTKLIQNIPEQNLNVIYNVTDTGLNSSTGEGWGLCVSPKTEIYCDGYTKNMEEIVLGDKVLDGNGNFSSVLGKIERNAKTISVNVTGLPKIVCTPEHPFLCIKKIGQPGYHSYRYKNSIPSWTYAKDINKGDYVGVPIPKWNKILPKEFDLVEWVKDDLDIEYDEENIWMRMGYSPNNDNLSISELQNKYGESKHTVENALKIIYKNKVARPNSRQAILAKKFKEDLVEKTQPVKIKRYIPVNKDFLNFVGWYLAEGWYNSGKFSLSLHKKELFIAEKFVKFFLETMDVYSVAKLERGNKSTFMCSSTILGIFFTKLCGKGAHDKKIHRVLWESSTSLAPLLDGYFSGDGYRSKTDWKITTVSKELAWQILFILRANGIFATFRQNAGRKFGFKSNSTFYTVGPGGYEEELFSNLIEREKISSNRKRAQYYLHTDEYIFAPIISIEDNIIQTVMDIKVENSHSFTGNGVILHNTNFEHAVTGAPQVVADHSALTELYKDCGLLVPTALDYVNMDSLTEGKLIRPEDMAESLEKLYTDKELYDDLSKKSIEKFSRKEYNWDYIVENDWLPLFRECTQ